MKRLRGFGFGVVAIAAALAWCVSVNVPAQLRANGDGVGWDVSDAGAAAHVRVSPLADGIGLFHQARVRASDARSTNPTSRSAPRAAAHAAALATAIAVLDASPILASIKSATFAHSTSAIPPPHA